METAEQIPVTSKPSWFRRVFNKLLPPSFESTPTPLTQPQSKVVVLKPSLAEIKPQVIGVGKVARETCKAAYIKAKSKPTEEVITPSQKDEPLVSNSEVKAQGLPSGFEKVRRSEQQLVVDKKDLPWLDGESLSISLAEITLAGSDRQRFFYGSAILGKELLEAANQLDEHRSRIANNLLYSHLPEFIRSNNHPYIKLVHDPVTERPIYNVYNKGGQRVYFMRFDKLQGIPVIIRVAVCDKDRQAQVLRVISTRSHKAIKHLGKL